mmetsp:Transcript_3058/g.5782  ORF Transcript_3058/g.5782 Transcript_3058/m.5782 type:complete len:107 (-) Transcript_3058:306-626(-)
MTHSQHDQMQEAEQVLNLRVQRAGQVPNLRVQKAEQEVPNLQDQEAKVEQALSCNKVTAHILHHHHVVAAGKERLRQGKNIQIIMLIQFFSGNNLVIAKFEAKLNF